MFVSNNKILFNNDDTFLEPSNQLKKNSPKYNITDQEIQKLKTVQAFDNFTRLLEEVERDHTKNKDFTGGPLVRSSHVRKFKKPLTGIESYYSMLKAGKKLFDSKIIVGQKFLIRQSVLK